MAEIRQTEQFAGWIRGLADRKARAKVLVRIDRLANGNPGDVAPIGEGVSELRIDYGPGYRVYFKSHGATLILLLAGGDKSSQSKDIKMAKALAANLKDEFQ
jgi:putative addiction module killer protein